jgi:FAD/FMN-containing dehydrogenase
MASPDEHPDLFWAIRGGGGNFGVVTRFLYALQPLPAFTGGMLIVPASAETIAGWIAASEAAPEELSTIANVMPAIPLPFLDEKDHGRLVIFGMVAFAGDDEAAEKAIAPFRALGEPLAYFVKPMPYPEMYAGEDVEYHPTASALSLFVDRVDVGVAGAIMTWLEASDAEIRVAQLRVLGGASARVPADATAYAHRASRIMVNVAAFYEGEEDRIEKQRWVEGFAAALEQDDKGVYVNFLGDEGPDRVRAAYPGATWERLVEIKRRYDPKNLFRRNQNITPS